MDTITIITIIILAAALILGAIKGFIRQLGSFAAVVIGIIACRIFSGQATQLAAKVLGVSPADSALNHYMCAIIGCAGVFLAVWLVVWLIARLIHKVISAVKLGPLNSVAGALFMAFKWMLVLSIAFNAWLAVSPTTRALARPSDIVEAVESIAPKVLGFIKDYASIENHTDSDQTR